MTIPRLAQATQGVALGCIIFAPAGRENPEPAGRWRYGKRVLAKPPGSADNAPMLDHIRNFSIIAHIDHGKSTLADRLLLTTGTVSPRQFRDQVLDSMDLERERGITIKASPVRMRYTQGGREYQLNLIDTPGHVDFSYEVSRSLAACEGALLLVDATQGVEAQTVANEHLARERNLAIIPIINKIDLPHARPDETAEEIASVFGMDKALCLRASAKAGTGVDEILAAIIARIPPPQGDPAAPLTAMIFDAVYDEYRGVVVHVRLYDGTLRPGDEILFCAGKERYKVTGVGTFVPEMHEGESLSAGEVGYLIAEIKRLGDVRIGDTVTHFHHPTAKPLEGYREPKPMVFCGFYPADENAFDALRKAMERLALNDSSFQYQPENSTALGLGFRCGFLGMLHMEIIQERLERGSGLEIVQTAPTVSYRILRPDGTEQEVKSPADVPEPHQIREFFEPVMRVEVIVPIEYIGAVMRLAEGRRAHFVKTTYLGAKRVILHFDIPLAEIIYDFHDQLKSATRGYATMDYEFIGYFPEDLVKLEILVNARPADALATIVHRDVAQDRGRRYLKVLRKKIPRHLFQIPLQAAIGGKIIARENIPALAKRVTAKCYGGDITRKRKLWEKQKEGKKRMRSIGQVNIPQEAFLAVLGARDEE